LTKYLQCLSRKYAQRSSRFKNSDRTASPARTSEKEKHDDTKRNDTPTQRATNHFRIARDLRRRVRPRLEPRGATSQHICTREKHRSRPRRFRGRLRLGGRVQNPQE